jgi:fructose transport system permease protein
MTSRAARIGVREGDGGRAGAAIRIALALVQTGPVLILALLVIAMSVLSPFFLTGRNITNLGFQTSIVAILALGQLLVILTRGIDLSVGSVIALSGVLGGIVAGGSAAGASSGHGALVLLVMVGCGAAVGVVNGVVLVKGRVMNPFIVTLGTLSIFTAITLIYAKGQTVSLQPGNILMWSGETVSIGQLNLTNGVLLMIALYVVIGYALRYTAWGRHLYAVGDDIEASRLAGISVNRVLLSAYVVGGFAIAVGAWILVGRVGGGDPNSGLNANLQSITAVVIGGTSLFGGRGVVIGSLIGALIVQVFVNGLALAGIDPNYQVLAVGVLVIAAVSVDQWIRSVKS